MKHNQVVAVLDFGSQYTQLIARRVREQSVYSEILPFDTDIEFLRDPRIKAVILSGGPSSVYAKKSPQISWKIKNIEKPVLGICYGMQLMIQQWGGEIQSTGLGEYGHAHIAIENGSLIFNEVPKETEVWMSHGDQITEIGQDWSIVAKSESAVIAAIHHKELPVYGVQFHPEVHHTIEGERIISNFLFKIADCKRDWTAENFARESIEEIQKIVGDNKVLCAISGGVDSAVVGVLLHEAIGDNLSCVFIDHGLLRKNETTEVLTTLNDGLGLQINSYDYSEKFLSKLKSVKSPERKRKIIGEEFIRAFEEITDKLGDFKFLAQGTLYPDVIESGGAGNGVSVVIKSHHNVGGLPEDMKFSLIEPVRDLFKDEVRKVGKEIGIPDFILNRHPFPGPGLAVRILGQITSERIKILQEADEIFIDILKKTGEYDNIWQAFSVLIPSKTVGVMGDSRTYENIIALRAVTSMDGMTADWYKMPSEVLNVSANRIINEVKGVNRVVYDITTKPPGTIEWE